jgi:hypothetical protein
MQEKGLAAKRLLDQPSAATTKQEMGKALTGIERQRSKASAESGISPCMDGGTGLAGSLRYGKLSLETGKQRLIYARHH